MLEDVRLLYVEDDSDIAEEVVYFLQRRLKELYVARDGKEAYELYKKYTPDVVVTDIQMPRMNGLDLSEKIREENQDIPIVITSAHNDTNFLTRSIALGITSYIIKPINLFELLKTLERVCEVAILRKHLQKRNEELESINKNLDAIVQEKTKDLEFLYYHDAVTTLQNRLALQEALEEKEFTYLVLLDMANFSYLNKQYGKAFADEVLIYVSALLLKHTNEYIHLYKIESDRFVFLLENSSQEAVEEFCQQIQSFFDTKKIEVDDIPIAVSFNIGIASKESQEDILVHAEYALDSAKTLGARYYTFYNERDEVVQQDKKMIEWLNITKEMIEADRIVPYFQPILDVKSNRVVKFEVLARGLYKNEVVSPIYFIEPAMRLGLISSITRMMIRKSFSLFASNDFAFSLNISERDLREEYLCKYLQARAKEYKINPSRVTLEILESVTSGTYHQEIARQINKIKALGFKVAIDDFGTENANFSRLMHMNFDYIKLDGTFMKDIQTSKRQQLIVKSIVELAKVLGIETIAEFVENEAVCHIARECGIDLLQGYYFGKPSPKLMAERICSKEHKNA